jgi:hypothetical protein
MKTIDKYLITEKKLPKAVKKFVDYCIEYGASKKDVDKLLKNHDLSDAIDEIMELVRDDVSPGDFDEIDSLMSAAQSEA